MFRRWVARSAWLAVSLMTAIAASMAVSFPASAALYSGAAAKAAASSDSLQSFHLTDGCGGANGEFNISSDGTIDAYGIIWENSSGCSGKVQELWVNYDSTLGVGNFEAMSADPGQSNGFHTLAYPDATLDVTLCSTGPSGFNCWDSASSITS